jgi:hypothetical protein
MQSIANFKSSQPLARGIINHETISGVSDAKSRSGAHIAIKPQINQTIRSLSASGKPCEISIYNDGDIVIAMDSGDFFEFKSTEFKAICSAYSKNNAAIKLMSSGVTKISEIKPSLPYPAPAAIPSTDVAGVATGFSVDASAASKLRPTRSRPSTRLDKGWDIDLVNEAGEIILQYTYISRSKARAALREHAIGEAGRLA